MAATTNYYLLSILLGCSLTTKTPGEATSVQTVVIKPNRSCFSLAAFMRLSELPANLSACRSSGTDFVPLVAETLGGLAEDTIRTITIISRAIENRCGTSDSTPTTSHLCGRVAIALWRGNASLWLHRLPTIPPSLDGVAWTCIFIVFFLFLFVFSPGRVYAPIGTNRLTAFPDTSFTSLMVYTISWMSSVSYVPIKQCNEIVILLYSTKCTIQHIHLLLTPGSSWNQLRDTVDQLS